MATYSDQQILDAARQALIDVLAGKRVRFNDGSSERWVESEDVDKIQKIIDTYQARVDGVTSRAAGAATIGGLRFSCARLDGR